MRNAEALVDEVGLASLDTIVFTNGIITSAERQESAEGSIVQKKGYIHHYWFLKYSF